MAVDYHADRIDGRHQPFLDEVLRIEEMDNLTAGYAGHIATWFDDRLLTLVNKNDICYSEGQISPYADPEDWFRIIKIPRGYLVDVSHLVDMMDDHRRLKVPVEMEPGPYSAHVKPVVAKSRIENPLQLEAVTQMLVKQYGFQLGPSILHTIAAEQSENPID
jgi:hypothetical protein